MWRVFGSITSSGAHSRVVTSRLSPARRSRLSSAPNVATLLTLSPTWPCCCCCFRTPNETHNKETCTQVSTFAPPLLISAFYRLQVFRDLSRSSQWTRCCTRTLFFVFLFFLKCVCGHVKTVQLWRFFPLPPPLLCGKQATLSGETWVTLVGREAPVVPPPLSHSDPSTARIAGSGSEGLLVLH